jgi:hypothetical protein
MNTVPSAHEALTRDVINSFLPIRRRKRTKRRNSSGLFRLCLFWFWLYLNEHLMNSQILKKIFIETIIICFIPMSL